MFAHNHQGWKASVNYHLWWFASCDNLERGSSRLTILAEDGRSKLRSPTKTVGVNHFAIRSKNMASAFKSDYDASLL